MIVTRSGNGQFLYSADKYTFIVLAGIVQQGMARAPNLTYVYKGLYCETPVIKSCFLSWILSFL